MRLLALVADAIEEHTDQFVMHCVMSTHTETGKHAGGCGTAACIAGWTVYLAENWKELARYHEDQRGDHELMRVAGNYLGIEAKATGDFSMSHPLFFYDHWPVKYRKAFEEAKTDNDKATVAVERIRDYIKRCRVAKRKK